MVFRYRNPILSGRDKEVTSAYFVPNNIIVNV